MEPWEILKEVWLDRFSDRVDLKVKLEEIPEARWRKLWDIIGSESNFDQFLDEFLEEKDGSTV